MKLSNAIAAANICIESIHREGYYTRIWETCKHDRPLAEYRDKQEVLKPFQLFWERLPDSPAIRRDPFFQVCNLAEDYCFGDEE